MAGSPDFISDEDMAKLAPDFLPDAEAAPAVPGLSNDVGPVGRRVRAGLPPGPRDVSDADLRLDAGPIINRGPLAGPLPSEKQTMFPGPSEPGGRPANWTNSPNESGDPILQGMMSYSMLRAPIKTGPGAAAAKAVASKLGPLARPLAGVGEGAATAAMAGANAGDIGFSAGLGGLFGLGGTLARGEEAAARSAARLEKDITKGTTKATGKVAGNVKFAGTEELARIADELPEVGKAWKTQAKTNPGAAAKATNDALDKLTDANDAAYSAIQRQHGGVPLQPIADRLEALEGRLNAQGRGVAADAVGRLRADWLKRYGAEPDAKLSAQQVRNIRNDMATVADPDRTIAPNTRRDALSRVKSILNKEIEDVGANTRGVNVDDLRTRNRQISIMIDVRDALAQRAEKLADREIGIVGLAKEQPKKIGQNAVRTLDYYLSRNPLSLPIGAPGLPPVVPITAARAMRDRAFATKVTDAMGKGMSLDEAVTAAGGE